MGGGRRDAIPYLFFLFAGLATLAKGLVGLLPPLLSILAYRALAYGPSGLRGLRLGRGLLLWAAVVLAWLVPAALAAGPAYFGGTGAGLAGMLVGLGGAGVDATTAFIALKALPVIILGGLDSMKGVYLAGLIIGVAEAFTRAHAGTISPLLGANFDVVVPYIIMVLVLLVRPYGFFGTPEVQRV